MKSVFTLLVLLSISLSVFAQSGTNAFHPMTANGAIGITGTGHILYWENPDSVYFNEIFFGEDSALVANLDPSALLLSGEPSTVYDSVQLNSPLSPNTKYFWCVAEWYLLNDKLSRDLLRPVWYFYTDPGVNYDFYEFTNDLEGWQAAGPQGTGNWYWSNTAHTSSYPGEAAFSGSPSFTGTSYLISPEIAEPAGLGISYQFQYYLDFNSDTATVGLGITTDNGVTWDSLWEVNATGDVGPETGWCSFMAEGNYRIGFYYKGNSDNINYFYVDEVWAIIPLTITAYPPSQLEARASYTVRQVVLNWDPGWALDPISGYWIQRQDGLPEDNNPYTTIGQTNVNTRIFIDTTVYLNENYTYRVSTFTGGYHSYFSNEASGYVPEVTPVELVSFTASANGNNVTLNWGTATETNNRGFEIYRQSAENKSNGDGGRWEKAGYVQGFGTTTEPHSYTFTDNIQDRQSSLSYRLKQIDFDGSYEYSKAVEVNINTPDKFLLEQNYPNPFNPATSISYSVPKDGFVHLVVYNVLGQKVTELVNENVRAGSHQVTFNAANLSSGVYYYRIEAGGFTATRKMILLR